MVMSAVGHLILPKNNALNVLVKGGHGANMKDEHKCEVCQGIGSIVYQESCTKSHRCTPDCVDDFCENYEDVDALCYECEGSGLNEAGLLHEIEVKILLMEFLD